jgi:hypothetical protein
MLIRFVTVGAVQKHLRCVRFGKLRRAPPLLRFQTSTWKNFGGGKRVMTFNEARTSRRTYLVIGSLALVSGTLILLVTLLKGVLFAYLQADGRVPNNIITRAILSIYEHGIVVSWLWPWMSETGFEGPSNPLLFPSVILGLAVIGVSAFLFKNAERLKRWIGEVKELLAKEEMAASRRPPSLRQSIGDVQAGRDSQVIQQITNHYNHRPDNPKVPIIAAIIGAIAVIAAALLRNS